MVTRRAHTNDQATCDMLARPTPTRAEQKARATGPRAGQRSAPSTGGEESTSLRQDSGRAFHALCATDGGTAICMKCDNTLEGDVIVVSTNHAPKDNIVLRIYRSRIPT